MAHYPPLTILRVPPTHAVPHPVRRDLIVVAFATNNYHNDKPTFLFTRLSHALPVRNPLFCYTVTPKTYHYHFSGIDRNRSVRYNPYHDGDGE